MNKHTVCAEQFATKRFPSFLHEFFVKLDSWWQFWICLSWGFRNTPYMFNLMKFWLRYLRLKTMNTIQNIDCSSIFYWLFRNQALSSTLNIPVNSSLNSKIRAVLESGSYEDFKLKSSQFLKWYQLSLTSNNSAKTSSN